MQPNTPEPTDSLPGGSPMARFEPDTWPPRTNWLDVASRAPARRAWLDRMQRLSVIRENIREPEPAPSEHAGSRWGKGKCHWCGQYDGLEDVWFWRKDHMTTRCRYCLYWSQERGGSAAGDN